MSITKRFAHVTTVLEDLHAVAVEGQAPDLPGDMQVALLGLLGIGVRELEAAMQSIRDTPGIG